MADEVPSIARLPTAWGEFDIHVYALVGCECGDFLAALAHAAYFALPVHLGADLAVGTGELLFDVGVFGAPRIPFVQFAEVGDAGPDLVAGSGNAHGFGEAHIPGGKQSGQEYQGDDSCADVSNQHGGDFGRGKMKNFSHSGATSCAQENADKHWQAIDYTASGRGFYV